MEIRRWDNFAGTFRFFVSNLPKLEAACGLHLQEPHRAILQRIGPILRWRLRYLYLPIRVQELKAVVRLPIGDRKGFFVKYLSQYDKQPLGARHSFERSNALGRIIYFLSISSYHNSTRQIPGRSEQDICLQEVCCPDHFVFP